MMSAGMLPDPVEIHRPGKRTDRYGNDADDWSRPTVTRYRARLIPQTTAEDTADRNAQVSEYRAVFPPGADLSGRYRAYVAGQRFEVVGPATIRRGLVGTPSHATVTLRRVEG